jgi:hypothetical protein
LVRRGGWGGLRVVWVAAARLRLPLPHCLHWRRWRHPRQWGVALVPTRLCVHLASQHRLPRRRLSPALMHPVRFVVPRGEAPVSSIRPVCHLRGRGRSA